MKTGGSLEENLRFFCRTSFPGRGAHRATSTHRIQPGAGARGSRQDRPFHAVLGGRAVKPPAHFGREFPDGLRQNPAEGLRLLQITRLHIEGGSIHSGRPPIYRPTNSPTRRVYSSRLSRYELACDAPGTTHSSLSPGLAP